MKRTFMSSVGLAIAAGAAIAGLFIVAFMILGALASKSLFGNK